MTWISVRSPVAFSEALFVEPQQGMVAVCFQGQSCYRYDGVDKQAINRLLKDRDEPLSDWVNHYVVSAPRECPTPWQLDEG